MKVNMKLPKNLGMLLLGIWLIVTGLLQVVSIHIPAIVDHNVILREF